MHEDNHERFLRRSRSFGNDQSLDEKWHRQTKSISNLSTLDQIFRNNRQKCLPEDFSWLRNSFRTQQSLLANHDRSKERRADNLFVTSKSQRHRRSRSFANISSSNKENENTNWKFFDSPKPERGFKVKTNTSQVVNKDCCNNLGRRTISHASSRAAANVLIPPPLPVKQKKLNQTHHLL